MHIIRMKIKPHLLKIRLIMAGVFLFLAASAQKGNLGNEEVEVIKPYQPVLSDAIKITSAPQRDTVSADPPVLHYRTEEKRQATFYNITPIKPVRIKDENIKELYRGFVKAGYGNYSTLYTEGFFNALRSKDFDAGLHLKHLSSSGKIKSYGFPGNSLNMIDLFGTKFFEQSALNGHLRFNREVNHFYGYRMPEIFSKQETRQLRNSFSGQFSYSSIHNDPDKFFYRAEMQFSSFSLKTANYEANESDFLIGISGGKRIGNDHTLKMDFAINPLKSTLPGNACPPGTICPAVALPEINVNRTILRLEPRYEFEKSGIQISAGANMAIEKSYDLSFWRFYPVVRLNYPLIKDQVSLTGELSGNLRKNTLQSLTEVNPFIIARQFPGTRLLINTNNKINVEGGLIIRPERQLQFLASAGYSRLLDEVFFVNTVNDYGITYYSPLYDTLNRINIHAEAQYLFFEKAGITVKSDYFIYGMKDDREPLFRPAFALTMDGHYNIAEKIYARATLFYCGSRKALATDGFLSLKPYADISLGIDYRFTKLLSFWLQANNLTASRYMQWYNYPSYRLSVMAGASLSF